MKPSEVEKNADSLVQNPFVLRAAWTKLQTYYSSCEGGPRLEMKQWTENPWHYLFQLSEGLVGGPEALELGPFERLPYPKPGQDILRPYCSPSVKGQVAHLVYLVLLTPFLEAQMECFSFGSRLYRPMIREKGKTEDGFWKCGPFSLSDEKLFTSYRRGYGLFRRVAHWVTSKWLSSETTQPPWGAATKEDYAVDSLPFVGQKYQIRAEKQRPSSLSYAKLDLKRAYPNARLDLVEKALLRMVGAEFKSKGYLPPPEWSAETHLSEPWRLLEKDPSLRVELAKRWMNLLRATSSTWEERSWPFLPAERLDCVNYDDKGLCTGLAVSPVLLNVLLTDLDISIANEWDEEVGPSFAYLRFADDIILIWVWSIFSKPLEGVARAPVDKAVPVPR